MADTQKYEEVIRSLLNQTERLKSVQVKDKEVKKKLRKRMYRMLRCVEVYQAKIRQQAENPPKEEEEKPLPLFQRYLQVQGEDIEQLMDSGESSENESQTALSPRTSFLVCPNRPRHAQGQE